MGIFRQFPYSNFHEMNMDEIIKLVRQLADEWAAYQEQWATYFDDTTAAFNDLRDYVYNYFNNLDVQDEINNKINAMVTDGTFEAIVADYINSYMKQRRVLIIGDSYNTGTGGGQSIPTMEGHIARKMQIPVANVFNYSIGGSGFSYNSDSSNPSFETNLDNAIAGISEKEKITDLCIIGGANDYNIDIQTLYDNMRRFYNKAKVAFPNATIRYFNVGWAVTSEHRKKYVEMYRWCSLFPDIPAIRLYYLLQDKTFMFNQFHPNQYGVQVLGCAIGTILAGGEVLQATEPREEYIFTDQATQLPCRTWCDADNVYIQFDGTPETLSAQKGIRYAATQLTQGRLKNLFGYLDSEITTTPPYVVFEALSAYTNNDSEYYEHLMLQLAFRRHSDGLTDTLLDVICRTFMTNADGSFRTIPCNRLYIAPQTVAIPIWIA